MVLMSSSVIRHSGNVENSLDARSFSDVSRRGRLALRQLGSSMLPNSFLGHRAMRITPRKTSDFFPNTIWPLWSFHCMIIDHEKEITKTNSTAVFFGSLHTQTSTTSVSAIFPLNFCIFYVQKFEQKSLKRMHFHANQMPTFGLCCLPLAIRCH